MADVFGIMAATLTGTGPIAPAPARTADDGLIKGPTSEGVKALWREASIRKARITRHKVTVTCEGRSTQYRSVPTAFLRIGLPSNLMIRFRLRVKRTGRGSIEHEGRKYVFELVPG